MMPEIDAILEDIRTRAGDRRIAIMEVCGTHTVSLFRTGARSLLPETIRLISGPGCPVCVTSQGYLDLACDLAAEPDVTICTYGDMVRVPGTETSLEQLRARGARVHVVYSARDALARAQARTDEHVVFLAVGFETTTPATAAVLQQAREDGVENFSILPGHKLVIPAMQALLHSGRTAIDGFLCPGHVSVILGSRAYQPVVTEFARSCVVAGFELRGMLEAIRRIVRQVVEGRPAVENAYSPAVTAEGNIVARRMVEEVFQPAPAMWRAMGEIPGSGLALRDAYQAFDAMRRFGRDWPTEVMPKGCRCGDVIQGRIVPRDCALFGAACTPHHPIGPCMVSSEGACQAYYKYGR